jgi:hypothetical protein
MPSLTEVGVQTHRLPQITPIDVRERTRKVLLDRPELRANPEKRLCEGATAVLECYLGKQWVAKHIATDQPNDFLVPKSDTPGLRQITKAYSRIVILAECLLTMQRVPGIAARVSDLQTKDIEGCFGELQGAMLLARARVPFVFREQTNTPRDRLRGSDYDIAATVQGVKVNCEMKAKCEGTQPNRSALRAQLKRARNQLPASEPNIVFLRIPESWMSTRGNREAVSQAIAGHFRDSTRVSSAVIHWEEWTSFAPEKQLHVVHYKQHHNNRASSAYGYLESIIDTWIYGQRDCWFDLRQFILSEAENADRASSTALLQALKEPMPFNFIAGEGH